MRILLVGDSHGNLGWFHYVIREVVPNLHCDRIVQLGDFGVGVDVDTQSFATTQSGSNRVFEIAVDLLAQQYDVDVWFLDGNHERWPNIDEWLGNRDFGLVMQPPDAPLRIGERLTYLPRGCVWEWDGVRFMAFGGAASIDRNLRIDGLSWWARELPNKLEIDHALDQGECDVLLTHDAPQGVIPLELMPHEPSLANRHVISALVNNARPKLLVHGHYHHRYTAIYRPTQTFVVGLDCDGAPNDGSSWVVLDTDDIEKKVYNSSNL